MDNLGPTFLTDSQLLGGVTPPPLYPPNVRPWLCIARQRGLGTRHSNPMKINISVLPPCRSAAKRYLLYKIQQIQSLIFILMQDFL